MSEEKGSKLFGVVAPLFVGFVGAYIYNRFFASNGSKDGEAKGEVSHDTKSIDVTGANSEEQKELSSPSKESKRKVKFDPEVLQQEEMKEIISMTIRETLQNLERSSLKDNAGATGNKRMDQKMRRRYSENDEPIYKVCFSGGPCAGKTTALTVITSTCEQLGFRTFIVPESATILMKAGFLINNTQFSEMQEIQFQSCLMRLQIFLEDLVLEYAAATSDKPVVVFCDRGLMDGKAYVSQKVWQAILDEMGWNEVYLRDSRYDAVVVMITAANGAEQYYDHNTNEARYEDLEAAKKVDESIQKNWSGHSQLYIIDNNIDSFEAKIEKTKRTVMNLLGAGSSTIFNRKFLLYSFKKDDVKVPSESFEVVEFYLQPVEGQQSKIIQKGNFQSYAYTLETKITKNEQVITRRKQITSREFIFPRKFDNTKLNLEKSSVSFMYKNQHFIIDTFVNVHGRPSLLRIETEQTSDLIEKPEFLNYYRDVTDEEAYATQYMANKDYKMPVKDYEELLKHNV
jgi:thymidylate kinase